MVTMQTVNAREADMGHSMPWGGLEEVTLYGSCFSNESALSPFGPPSTQQPDLSLRYFKSPLIKGEKRAEETSSCVR